MKLETLSRATDMYLLGHTRLPGSLDELAQCKDASRCFDKLTQDSIYDAWERSFIFTPEGSAYSIMSLGKDLALSIVALI